MSAFPVAAILRKSYPAAKLYFCSARYTKPLVEVCEHFDGFVCRESIIANPAILSSLNIDVLLNLQSDQGIARAACSAKVPVRVTNLRRQRGARFSNRFMLFSRSSSRAHSIALNLRMLRALKIADDIPPADWPALFGLSKVPPLCEEIYSLLDPTRFNLVLHPKSGGHGREWPLEHFVELIDRLPHNRFKIFVTGTVDEHATVMRDMSRLLEHPRVTNLMGRFLLPEFLALLRSVDGLVASGTGPLHLAAAFGCHALGIFPPRRNMDAAKWKPIGVNAETVSFIGECTYRSWKCQGAPDGPPCHCTASILPETVANRIAAWLPETVPAHELNNVNEAHCPSTCLVAAGN